MVVPAGLLPDTVIGHTETKRPWGMFFPVAFDLWKGALASWSSPVKAAEFEGKK